MRKYKKYVIAFLILYVIGFILYGEFVSKPKYANLKKNYLLTTGYTYSYTPGVWYKNNPPRIKYRYKIDGKDYEDDLEINHVSGPNVGSYLLYKTFPVAIDKNDFSNSAILIEPKRFDDFRIKFPDSLNWILKYVK